ncbi:extracellular solute-binding protein [Thioclava sp. GXIMD2076]|uniref:ABC transporter substrate-binding protein n=1 Tax=Thioclava sp. GXIMD2076 TaxID=3131931 RepID=UPI0030D34469
MIKPTRYLATTSLLVVTGIAPAFAQDNPYYDAAVAEAKKIAAGKDLAGSLEMIGQASGAEGQTLQTVYDAFKAGTGVDVRYTGSPDTATVVQSRVQAGNPPDVADIALGAALNYAKEGVTLDLSSFMGDELSANYNSMLLDTASYEGKTFGIFQHMNTFMVWYNPETYTGPNPPESWQALSDWADGEAAKGNPVWCAAQGAGGSSGFPGAQMVDNIFLKTYGPELYAQWGKGELAWTSPEVKGAFEEFGRTIGAADHLSGGPIGAISTPISVGYNGLTSTPPTCQLALWAAWVPGLIGETAKPGENIDFFRVPAADPAFANYELYQASISVGLTDTPTTRAFLEFMASDAAQSYLASQNRWPVANKNVPVDAYSSKTLHEVAEEFFANPDVEFVAGPNTLNAPATSSAYYKAVVGYMQNPKKLDSLLQSVQATVE